MVVRARSEPTRTGTVTASPLGLLDKRLFIIEHSPTQLGLEDRGGIS
jgi:hypothetical protein